MKKKYFGLLFLIVLISSCSPAAKDCNEYNSKISIKVCLINLALEKKDISICTNDNPSCYSTFWDEFPDESTCEKIELLQQKDFCYNSIAMNKTAIIICDKINSQNQRDRCLNAISKKLMNTSGCKGILNATMRDNCLSKYFPGSQVDDCYIIEDEVLKERCELTIAMRDGNYSFCESITDSLNKDICYSSIASLNGDIEKCSFISDTEKKTICIIGSARAEEDIRLCSSFPDALKETCISNVGGALGKPELCQSLTIAREKERCLKYATQVQKAKNG